MIYHFCWEVEIKRLVARPEASSQDSHRQVNSWICYWIIAQILLKAGLILPCQCQICDLEEEKKNVTREHSLKYSIVDLDSLPFPPSLMWTGPHTAASTLLGYFSHVHHWHSYQITTAGLAFSWKKKEGNHKLVTEKKLLSTCGWDTQ